jgi:hypothetical protein
LTLCSVKGQRMHFANKGFRIVQYTVLVSFIIWRWNDDFEIISNLCIFFCKILILYHMKNWRRCSSNNNSSTKILHVNHNYFVVQDWLYFLDKNQESHIHLHLRGRSYIALYKLGPFWIPPPPSLLITRCLGS